MWRQLLGSSLLWASVSVSAEEHSVSLALEQWPDVQCDGVPDRGVDVTPGGCLIYRIIAVNQGSEAAHQVVISADIPECTHLYKPLSVVQQPVEVSVNIKELAAKEPAGASLIKATIGKLPPGQAQQVVLTYSVRVL